LRLQTRIVLQNSSRNRAPPRIAHFHATRSVPVVILTSSKEERDLIRGYNLGVEPLHTEAVDFGQFRETIKNIGLYWLVIFSHRRSSCIRGLLCVIKCQLHAGKMLPKLKAPSAVMER
jgi:hypothetical protein